MLIKKRNFIIYSVILFVFTALLSCGIFAAVAKSINFNLTMYLNPTIYFALDLQIDEDGDGEFTTASEQKIYRIFDNTAANGDHVGWAIVNMNKIILQNTDAVDNPFGDLGINACFKITVTNLTDAAAQGISESDEEFQHLWLTLKPTEFSNMYAVPDYGVQNVGVGEEKAKSFMIYPQTISTDYFEIPFTVELKQKTYDHNIVLNIADDACPVNGGSVEIKWQTPQNTVTNGHNFTNRMISDYDAIPIESVRINGVDVVYSYNSETLEFSISGTNLTAANNHDLIITIEKVGYKLLPGREMNTIMNAGISTSTVAPATITGVTFDFDADKYNTIKSAPNYTKIVNQKADVDLIRVYIKDNKTYILSNYNIFLNENAFNTFYSYQVLASIIYNNFNTDIATNMTCFYDDCFVLSDLKLSKFNTKHVISFDYFMDACKALTSIDLAPLDTSSATSMSGFFYNCESLEVINISTLDTSKVTNMSNMFRNCPSLHSLNLSTLNTGNVTNMLYMFHGCTGLGTNGGTLNLDGWNTSKVTNMSSMFKNCSGFTSLDLTGLNTSSVTTMESMFENCTGLTSINLSSFNTSKVTSMYRMFAYCSALPTINLSNFNPYAVQTMSYMFRSCSKLDNPNLSNWTCASLQDAGGMFESCTSMTTLDMSTFTTSGALIDTTWMFAQIPVKVLNLRNFYTHGLEKCAGMFIYCSKLTTIYVSDKFVLTKVYYSTSMFKDCSSLVGGSGSTLAIVQGEGVAAADSYLSKYARVDGGAGARGYFTAI